MTLRRAVTWLQVRTALLFTTGLVGFIRELQVEGTERPTFLLMLGAMMGVPVFLRADEKHKPDPPAPPATTEEPPA